MMDALTCADANTDGCAARMREKVLELEGGMRKQGKKDSRYFGEDDKWVFF